jgi:stage III sporulation protein AA
MLDMNFLPGAVRAEAERMGNSLCEIRLRRGGPVQLVDISGGDALFPAPDQARFTEMVSVLMGHSLYAREGELASGFLTLAGGNRAGISGAFGGRAGKIGDIADISSVCIRIAHERKGCADKVMERVRAARGVIIISPPGLGKTTLLRDIVRQLSCGGMQVSLMDERGEVAACRRGAPSLDVGPRTDVYSLCPKAEGMLLALRAMAPDVIAADELGAAEDAAAVREAARCGVRLVTTAHGDSLRPERLRGSLAALVAEGIFDAGILLGPKRGEIAEMCGFS